MEQRVLQNHLDGGGLVNPITRNLGVGDVVHVENRVRIPQFLDRDKSADDFLQACVGRGDHGLVRMDFTARAEKVVLTKTRVIRIRQPVRVAPRRRAHVTTFGT